MRPPSRVKALAMDLRKTPCLTSSAVLTRLGTSLPFEIPINTLDESAYQNVNFCHHLNRDGHTITKPARTINDADCARITNTDTIRSISNNKAMFFAAAELCLEKTIVLVISTPEI